MRKLLIFFLLFFFFSFSEARAEGEFQTDIEVTYIIDENGQATVSHGVLLTNLFSNLYATSYSLVLENIEPVSPKAFQNDSELPLEVAREGDKTSLRVSFPDNLVGKDRSRNFRIEFGETKIANKTGEVWEISIPRISSLDSFNSYNLKLIVPKTLGSLAYLSPDADSSYSTGTSFVYNFGRSKVADAGITAGFGEFQVFDFTLNYHLENPLPKRSETKVAIPPDTALQKMYYTGVTPTPKNIEIDPDGNWLAVYSLAARERIDVTVTGSVQIFSTSRPFRRPSQEVLNANLTEKKYWEVEDQEIKNIAGTLKTPKEIYDYVVKTLTYNYDRVRPNTDRLGAKAVLQNPTAAICMEFTDLFVTLARAAGIPAREVNGFAYTENPEIQPLSLVADVLHAWPEYWDNEREAWISVDPTWGSTTGGIDFFNKLDLRHFTFVMHGMDSEKPFPPGSYKLGVNPQKDVFVSFGRLPEKRTSEPEIIIKEKSSIPFFPQKFLVIVKNSGPASLNNVPVNIYFDQNKQEGLRLETLIPYTAYEFEVAVPFSFLGGSTPHNVSVEVLGSRIQVPTAKNLVVIYSFIGFSLFLVGLIVFLLIRLKGMQISQFSARLKRNLSQIYANTASKFKKDKKEPPKP